MSEQGHWIAMEEQTTEVITHPAIARMLAQDGAEWSVFADNGARRWIRVLLRSGKRFVVVMPSEV